MIGKLGKGSEGLEEDFRCAQFSERKSLFTFFMKGVDWCTSEEESVKYWDDSPHKCEDFPVRYSEKPEKCG